MSIIQVDKDGIAKVDYESTVQADAESPDATKKPRRALVKLAMASVSVLPVGVSLVSSPFRFLAGKGQSLVGKGLRQLTKPKPTDTENILEIIEQAKGLGVQELTVSLPKSTFVGLGFRGISGDVLDVQMGVQKESMVAFTVKFK